MPAIREKAGRDEHASRVTRRWGGGKKRKKKKKEGERRTDT